MLLATQRTDQHADAERDQHCWGDQADRQVHAEGPVIFGGHDNKVQATTDPEAPVLRVRATAVFGGVEVRTGTVRPQPTVV